MQKFTKSEVNEIVAGIFKRLEEGNAYRKRIAEALESIGEDVRFSSYILEEGVKVSLNG